MKKTGKLLTTAFFFTAMSLPHDVKQVFADDVCTFPQMVSGREILLVPSCTYKGPVLLAVSGVSVDCRGATIDAMNISPYAIYIGSDRGVRDISVSDCNVRGAVSAEIAVRMDVSKETVINKSPEYLNEIAPKNILLHNIVFDTPSSHGLYIGEYTQNVTVEDSEFRNFKNLAVYLDYSSSATTINRTAFLVEGSSFSRREAIAIDSSEGNVVSGCTFRGNIPMAIMLYKNCQEHVHTLPFSPKRVRSAAFNMIRKNLFAGLNVGVWIGARQSRNMADADCGDPYYGNGKFVLDKANNNTLSQNNFDDVRTPVVIEDDNATVEDNRFFGDKLCVKVGSGPRFEYLHRPVVGTRVINNVCNTQKGDSSGFAFIYGTSPAVFKGNSLNGVNLRVPLDSSNRAPK